MSNPSRLAAACLAAALWLAAGGGAARAQCPYDDRVTGEILVELEYYGDAQEIADRYGLVLVDGIPEMRVWSYVLPDLSVPNLDQAVDSIVDQLKDDDDVDRAEPHRNSETPEGGQLSIPDLGAASSQTVAGQDATATVNAAEAHVRYTGRGVRVAVLDTGMAFDHPLTAGALLTPGADFAGGDGTARPFLDGADNDGDGVADEAAHHGTFVAGLVHLVAPDAQIIPVRVLDAEGRGSILSVAKGIRYAVQQGARVINLSQSMLHDTNVLEDAIQDAIHAGVVVVVATGNRAEIIGLPIVDATIEGDCQSFPASMIAPGLVAVAAVDAEGLRAPFSDYGPQVALSAPGVDLHSSFGDDFASWDGTSFAAPLVSGAAALILEKYPGLRPGEVHDLLVQTAQPDANPPELEGLMGAGILDLDALTQALAVDRQSLRVHRTPEGTAFEWSPVLGATAYDLARGRLTGVSLFGAAGDCVELGSLSCLANDAGAPAVVDRRDPLPGQVFFYVFRDDGRDPEGDSYGRASKGRRRIPGATDCPIDASPPTCVGWPDWPSAN